MDGITTIITYIKRGDFADRPVAADLHALIHPNTSALFYAEDTKVLYILNRDTVDWDTVLVGGGGAANFVDLSDVDLTSLAADDLFMWDGYNVVNITPAALLTLIGAAPATSGTDILKGDGSGGFDPAVAGTDYAEATPGSADDPLFSDGAGGFTAGTRHGNTTDVATVDGATTAGNRAVWDADGNIVDGGAPGSSGAGGSDKSIQYNNGGALGGIGPLTDGQLVIGSTGNTSVAASLTQPAAGLTITGGAGTITFALGNDLAALEGMSGTGLVARTASETYAQRTITGTSNRLSVTNGDGVSGNPTLDIHASYVGQTSITTLGTIGTGTWQGTTIAVDYGGTGLASYTQGDIIYASGATTLAKLAKNTSSTRYLSNTGSSNNPAWTQVDLSNGVTGVLGGSNGGAGTANGILKANGSGTVSAASAGTDYVAPTGVGLVFNLLMPITGLMTNAEKLVPDTIIPACSFPSGAAGSYGISEVAATGSATITCCKNGVAFATFAWSGAGTTATITIGSTTSFNGSSDKFSMDAPATADATLADIGINLAGTRA